jgi:hypothetical protein
MADLVRGTQYTFTAEFKEFDGSPMVPANYEDWPQTVIKDTEGTVVATGVGTQVAAGKWQFNWFVPVNADLTAEDESWTIDWTLVTNNGHSRSVNEHFRVIDKIESTPEERQQTYLTNDGGMIRALMRRPKKLTNVKLTVKNDIGGEPWMEISGVASNASQSDPDNPLRLINEVVQDGEYIYYYDVGPLSAGEYQFHWTMQESAVSPIDVEVQIGRAVPDIFWHYNVELRTLIDKLQKSLEAIQSYSDADVFSYVKGGLDILNFYDPPTNFVLSDIPLVGSRGLRTALIYTSALHAINAQQILEVELNFDHSGQIVTLGYNHDYSGVLSSLESILEKFAESKIKIFRRAHGVAYSGARVKNFRWQNRVFRLDQTLRGIVPPGGAALWRNLGI